MCAPHNSVHQHDCHGAVVRTVHGILRVEEALLRYFVLGWQSTLLRETSRHRPALCPASVRRMSLLCLWPLCATSHVCGTWTCELT